MEYRVAYHGVFSGGQTPDETWNVAQAHSHSK